jgi:hypothetical protein
MRTPWITGAVALRQRMINPQQVAPAEPEAEMPPYMESFLAHLRLLVGVPFEYLIPDPRLLPDESIRFFYLDRSWADRLVDGAIAVGKVGTREQAHHQAHSAPVGQQLDLSERIVRSLQRGRGAFADLKAANDQKQQTADVVTGFLLRSAAVSGWPHIDVRAYSVDIPEKLNPSDPHVSAVQLTTLRLELLSPSVMLALFQGIPQLVYLEEPHHNIQFGVNLGPRGAFEIDLRTAGGEQVRDGANNPIPIPVPVRAGHRRVIHVSALRRALHQQKATHAAMPEQNGSAAFATEVLQVPWRQRFEGSVDHAEQPGGTGAFVSVVLVNSRVALAETTTELTRLLQANPGGGD